MNTETVKREWFGAVRSAADSAGEKLKKKSALTPLQAVKLDILLRQYLCDNITEHIMDGENYSVEKTKELQKDIYSGLIEDAIAGIWSEPENMEITMFLYECTKGVESESLFAARLEEILPLDDSTEIMLAMMAGMDKDIEDFTSKRKERWMPKKSSNEDEPPPWLDEFEYIDWVMTH